MTRTPRGAQETPETIDRREALRRAALLLGGALAAPTVAGVLAGCQAARVPDGAWAPRALTRAQADLVAAIAEHILPETDTPGARAAGVHRFIDAMLAESYPAPERQRFLAGLADVDARAERASGRSFLQCAATDQRALLDVLDREAFAATASPPDRPPETPGSRPGSDTDPGRKSGVRGGTPDEPVVRFFRTMKQLTLVGYYTSEIGATRELHHSPVPGRYDGCVPVAQVGRTWAV
jgi:glucoside 3-dehydrogenase (cytochrome c) hitch-hiker subunit